MRILQVITSLRTGGAEKLVTDMIPLFMEKGHQVDVVIFDGSDSIFKKRLRGEGIRIYELSKRGGYIIHYIL